MTKVPVSEWKKVIFHPIFLDKWLLTCVALQKSQNSLIQCIIIFRHTRLWGDGCEILIHGVRTHVALLTIWWRGSMHCCLLRLSRIIFYCVVCNKGALFAAHISTQWPTQHLTPQCQRGRKVSSHSLAVKFKVL